MPRPLAEVLPEQTALLEEISQKYDAAGEEPSESQITEIEDLNKKLEKLEDERKSAERWEGGRNNAREALERLKSPDTHLTLSAPGVKASGKREAPKVVRLGTIGHAFLKNALWADWWEKNFPNGVVNDKIRVESPAVTFTEDDYDAHFKGIADGRVPRSGPGAAMAREQEMKTLVTGLDNAQAGALILSQQLPMLDLPLRPLGIRDVITVGNTTSDTIEYPMVTGFTNNAAPVAEATAATGTSGTKPESGFALSRTSTTVKTIAHWIPATKRALADAGQVRTMIDNFLRYGLAEELEDQIVYGTGVGENLLGILNFPGLTVQAYDAGVPPQSPLLVTTRRARTKVRTVGRANPTAYLMNPLDWESLDLTTDAEGRYYYGGPMVLGTPRLWGLPVVENEGMTVGRALVGDLRQVVLWDREQASIQVTDSHSDFFIRNMVAILAEIRAALGILRPAAIVDIDLTP
jgi:HK97 family phage major capsid protein